MSTIEDQNIATGNGSLNIEETLHGILAERARVMGQRRAYTFQGKDGDVTITFSDLDRRARAIAQTLQKTIQPGDRVLLLFHAGLDFISAFFGCLYAGALAVPTTYPKPRRPMPRLTAIARNCDAVAALTDSDTLATIDKTITASELPDIDWIGIDSIDGEATDDFVPVEDQKLAFLQYTSGSTSDPKGVMVSHANLLHNLEMIRQGFGLRSVAEGGEIQTGVFWLPAYHDMGLIGGILETLYVGGHSVLMSPAAFLQRPIGWLETMSEHCAAITGAPNFAYELCVDRSTIEQRRALDLSSWKLAFCGAEPIRPRTLRSFAQAFEIAGFKESVFYPCFGLAESTLLAAGGAGPAELTVRYIRRSAMAEHRVEFVEAAASDDEVGGELQAVVGCGGPLHGHGLAIVDPESRKQLPSDAIGEIWVKGASVACGYWGHEEETRRTFHATLDDGEGPYMRTGDLGFFTDGHLFVTGRLKDVVIIRGRNHYPQDVERVACQSHEALRPDSGAVFTLDQQEDGPDRLVIVHEVDRHYREADFDEVIRKIRRAVSDELELDAYSVVLIRQASLPRTTSGKVQRNHCREQLLEGKLRVLAEWKRKPVTVNGEDQEATETRAERLERGDRPMTPDEIDRLSERVESWLLNWLVERAAIPREEVHRDKPFAEYGLDSLTAVELSQELEDWLGVEVVPTVAWNYPTPATLSVYLAREAGGANKAASASVDDVPVDDEFARLLEEIEGMSEADAQTLLEDENF